MKDVFPITIADTLYTVYPQEDETFIVHRNGIYFARIFPAYGKSGDLEWHSGDLIPQDYAQSIGEAIERYEA